MLQNAYVLAKVGFDTAENEPAKNLQSFQNVVKCCQSSLRKCIVRCDFLSVSSFSSSSSCLRSFFSFFFRTRALAGRSSESCSPGLRGQPPVLSALPARTTAGRRPRLPEPIHGFPGRGVGAALLQGVALPRRLRRGPASKI